MSLAIGDMEDCMVPKSNDCQKVKIRSSNGFALIAALLAILILTAVGSLAFVVSTQDVRTSSRLVGEKKAFFAAEGGIPWLLGNFDPRLKPIGSADPTLLVSDVQVDPANDPESVYSVTTLGLATEEPESLPMPGFSMMGIQSWAQERYEATVTGRNTRYASNARIDLSLGHGPVEAMTTYR
jgi:Tfp pilus assembly protein PilX